MNDTDSSRKSEQYSNKEYLSGFYKLSGAYLKPKGDKSFESLLISERNSSTITKTAEFLLIVLPDKQRKYVSSLYPKAPGVYQFDYLGIDYELSFEGKECYISVLEVENV